MIKRLYVDLLKYQYIYLISKNLKLIYIIVYLASSLASNQNLFGAKHSLFKRNQNIGLHQNLYLFKFPTYVFFHCF